MKLQPRLICTKWLQSLLLKERFVGLLDIVMVISQIVINAMF